MKFHIVQSNVSKFARLSRLLLGVAVLLPGVIHAQVTEPIPPPTLPNMSVGGFTSLKGTLRAKATPDECWRGLGLNVRYDFINQANPSLPCSTGIPKVDQGYVWGAALVNGVLYFGTTANAQCVGEGGVSTNPNGPTPYATDAWGCEFSASAYSNTKGGPLPPQIADQRPARMYAYNISTKVITDITPKLGGAPPAATCGTNPPGTNPLCVDAFWNPMRGVRTVTGYTEPRTGKAYVLISGPGLLNPLNPSSGKPSLIFYAWDVAANRWAAKYALEGYNDMRHWITQNGVTYAPVGKPNPNAPNTPPPGCSASACGGAILQYTGNFGTVPPPPTPSSSNGFNQIPVCGTTSTAIPPAAPPPPAVGVCFAFQDVGDFDGPATDAVVHTDAGSTDSRIMVGSWPPPGFASIFMSPAIPAGGLGKPAQAPDAWTRVWTINNSTAPGVTGYDPDPVIAKTIGSGAMAEFNNTLYWGTMVYPLAGTGAWANVYGMPTDPGAQAVAFTNTFRTAAVFRGNNFVTGTPHTEILYGDASYFVWNPTTSQWVLTPNQTNLLPVYGAAGFGNPYNNYIWTMQVFNNKLYIGTMDWGFMAADGTAAIAEGQGLPVPDLTKLIPPQQYGADLYWFKDNSSPAVQESIAGGGNYLNYGFRAMMANGTTSLYIGTANPMNISTTSTTTPHGGWELIEATLGTVTKGR